MKYTLEDIQLIQDNGFEYTLNDAVIVTLNDLLKQVSPPPSRNNTFQPRTFSSNIIKYENSNKNKSNVFPMRNSKIGQPTMNSIETDTTWQRQNQKIFVTTKIDKKEGIDKLINDVRICLNKMSGKNYDVQRDLIFQYINDIIAKFEHEEEEELLKNKDLNKIAVSIFETASTNKFYSEMYANLYKELTGNYSIFKEIISDFKNTYLNSMNHIHFVDSTVDYDKFCLNNKENDKRKAMTVFLVNLVKKTLFESNEIVRVIIQLLDVVIQYVDEPNKVNEVDEITENIFLFISTSGKTFIKEELWESVVSKITQCSQYKVKEHQSISSRAIFKYKDMIDLIKKN